MRIFLVIIAVIFLLTDVVLFIGSGLYMLVTKNPLLGQRRYATTPPELKEKLARYKGLGLLLFGIGIVGCVLFALGNALDGQTWMKHEYVFDVSMIIGVVGAIIIAGATIYFKRHLTSSSHNDT